MFAKGQHTLSHAFGHAALHQCCSLSPGLLTIKFGLDAAVSNEARSAGTTIWIMGVAFLVAIMAGNTLSQTCTYALLYSCVHACEQNKVLLDDLVLQMPANSC